MRQDFKLLSSRIRYLITWFLLAGLPVYLTCQSDYQFRAYFQEGSTSTNTIRNILQDDQGFIWMATDNGLCRFDGREFLRFRFDPTDPNSIASNQVTKLILDSQQNLWIGTSHGLNRLNLATGILERINLIIDDKPNGAAYVRGLLEDQAHNVWVATQSKGLFKFTPTASGMPLSSKHFQYDFEDERSQSYRNVSHLIEDDLGYLWVGGAQGFDRMDKETETFSKLTHPTLAAPKTFINNISKDHLGNIIFTIQAAGVFYIDPTERQPKIRPYFELDFDSLYSYDFIYSYILQDDQKQYWLGTENGLIIIDSTKTRHSIFRHDPSKIGTLSSSIIRSLYEDQAGEMWVGTHGGLNRKKQTTDGVNYSYYQNSTDDQATISSGQVRTIAEDLEGKLWVGHLNTGLEQFDWKEQEQQLVKLQHLQYDPSQSKGLLSNNIIQVFVDRKGFLWIGTNGQGLNKLNPRTGQLEAFVHDPNDPFSLSGNRIWGICEDKDGFIWVGEFTSGFNRLDPATGKVKRFAHQPDNPNSLSHNKIKTMLLDDEGQLWIGTNLGLNKFEISSETFTHYLHEPEDEHSLSSSHVFSLYEDADQNLWVGTAIGLNKLSAESRVGDQGSIHFERFYEEDGLPSNTIYGIQGDENGNLWVGTDYGLARLLPKKKKVTFSTLDPNEKVRYENYPPKAHYYSRAKGRVFFGSRAGLFAIQTTPGGQSRLSAPIRLGEISKYSETMPGSVQLIDHFVASTKELVLTHRDRIVSFKFSDLDWDKSKAYEYQLIGFDNEWRKLPEDMEATFTNLTPGRYTLMAREQDPNNKSTASTQLLQIRVYPPWWKSSIAYFAYILLSIGLLYFVNQLQLRRQNEIREKENLEILNEYKDKLYTNITHEFRTPLTVIGGAVEQVDGNEEAKDLIRRNSANLLGLVNQILKLRKLRSTEPEVNWVQSDIIAYLRSLLRSFEVLAEGKNIKFHFLSKRPEWWMDFDREKLEIIINNLLSNAIKFTPEQGHIYLQLEKTTWDKASQKGQDVIKIEVTDTGVGLSAEQQQHIFDRFYQVQQDLKKSTDSLSSSSGGIGPVGSTGIGLSISKELVELMGGEISVQSRVQDGTSFTILLPVHQTAAKVSPAVLEVSRSQVPIPRVVNGSEVVNKEFQEISTSSSEALTLLLIEDNADVVTYLRRLLGKAYELYVATDGEEGIELALEKIPDLILSDVMMPKKDGFEVCETLKNDLRTSHIPIVLLTAKASIESRLQGLRRGADAYLPKPFHQEELFLTLANLAKLRQGLQNRYQSLKLETAPPDEEQSDDFQLEDAFMAKLLQTVEANLHDPRFGTNELCREIGLSRTHLHRKITALTNRSTSNFIRSVRLRKGQDLLSNTELNINEIAYEIGFNDPSYFTRKFVEEFGESPTHFRKG